MSITRRSFLKGSAATAALSMVGSSALNVISAPAANPVVGPGNKWPGRVVTNFNKNATTGNTVDETAVKKMVDDAIMFLTGEETVGAAWKAVFPSTLTTTSKIAIKTNTFNAGNPCPHAFSLKGITEGLQQIDLGGTKFPAANITIYEMNSQNKLADAGYTAEKFPGITLKEDSYGSATDGAVDSVGNKTEKYASTLSAADFLINVFSPRGHMASAGGFTLGFKSHYGTYACKYHDNTMTRYIRDINCTGPVFKKTVLSICSGIFGMNEGNGPTGGADNYSTYSKLVDSTSTNVNPTTIIMSTDPVSCEMQAIKIIRMNKGKSYATADLPAYLRASGGISGALTGTTYNIGIIDESQMDVRKIINGTRVGTAVNRQEKTYEMQKSSITVSQMKGHGICFIEYTVPVSFVNQQVQINIFNIAGQKIWNYNSKIQGFANNFSWNEKDLSGHKIPAGSYIVNLQSGSLRISSQFSITH